MLNLSFWTLTSKLSIQLLRKQLESCGDYTRLSVMFGLTQLFVMCLPWPSALLTTNCSSLVAMGTSLFR